jgi:RimJ/RimL family protein N-acetyltransferase
LVKPEAQENAALHLRPVTIEDGMTVASWHYPGPWAVNDNLEAPGPDEGFWAVESERGELVGYCSFGHHARVPGLDEAPNTLDVSMGVRPDLRGRGLSAPIAEIVLARAQAVADGRRLRCIVAEWNDAGRRVAESSGFVPCGAHEFGATRYVVFSEPYDVTTDPHTVVTEGLGASASSD